MLFVSLRVDPPSLVLYWDVVCLSICMLDHPPWHYNRIMYVSLRVGPFSLALYWDVVCLSAWHYIGMLSLCLRVGQPCLPGAILGCCLYKIVLKIIDDDLSALDKKRASDEAAHLSELHMC